MLAHAAGLAEMVIEFTHGIKELGVVAPQDEVEALFGIFDTDYSGHGARSGTNHGDAGGREDGGGRR